MTSLRGSQLNATGDRGGSHGQCDGVGFETPHWQTDYNDARSSNVRPLSLALPQASKA